VPSDRFCFVGFPPRKSGERARWFAALAQEPRTIVFFESPHRIAATLQAAAQGIGVERPAVVCRELTKTYEEVRRGSLGQLAEWAAAGLRGEITIVVAGLPVPLARISSPSDWVAAVQDAEAAGQPRKEAMKAVSLRYGVPKREVFDAIVTHAREP